MSNSIERKNKIEKLEFLCNLTLSKNIDYSDADIYAVIEHSAEAFKIGKNEITLTKNEKTKIFHNVKELFLYLKKQN